MKIKLDILKDISKEFKNYPYCLSTGILKNMQGATSFNGSIRYKDKKIKCKHCDGTGRIVR